MGIDRFQCLVEGEKAPRGAISCDGLVSDCALHLSHWRGNRTPDEFKADASTEIAFKFLASEEAGRWRDAPLVNNHFDTDGVLTVWALAHPQEALKHRDLMIAAAEAGDFEEWPEDERGLWVDAAIRAIGSSCESEQDAYTAVFPRLTGLLEDIEAHSELWMEEQKLLIAAREAVNAGTLEVSSLGKIGIVRHPENALEIPGPLLSKLLLHRSWRYLLVFGCGDDHVHYRYEMPRYCWAHTVVRKDMAGPNVPQLVQRLGPPWTTQGFPGLTVIAGTALPVKTSVEVVTAGLLADDPELRAGAAPPREIIDPSVR